MEFSCKVYRVLVWDGTGEFFFHQHIHVLDKPEINLEASDCWRVQRECFLSNIVCFAWLPRQQGMLVICYNSKPALPGLIIRPAKPGSGQSSRECKFSTLCQLNLLFTILTLQQYTYMYTLSHTKTSIFLDHLWLCQYITELVGQFCLYSNPFFTDYHHY